MLFGLCILARWSPVWTDIATVHSGAVSQSFQQRRMIYRSIYLLCSLLNVGPPNLIKPVEGMVGAATHLPSAPVLGIDPLELGALSLSILKYSINTVAHGFDSKFCLGPYDLFARFVRPVFN